MQPIALFTVLWLLAAGAHADKLTDRQSSAQGRRIQLGGGQAAAQQRVVTKPPSEVPPQEYLPPPPSQEYLPPPKQQAPPSPPSDEYLPPPKQQTPPPPPSDEYLPPPKQQTPPPPPSDEYLPPPKQQTPPPPPSDEYLPPPPPNEYLPPRPSAEAKEPESPAAGGPSGEEGGGASVVVDAGSAESGAAGESEAGPPPRDGYCPRPAPTRSCFNLQTRFSSCFTDQDCGPQLKCCSVDCNLRCVPPVTRPRSCDQLACNGPLETCVDGADGPRCVTHTKPGQCPYNSGQCSNRNTLCEKDSQCDGDKLCCNLGCQRLCVQPASPAGHAGFCPDVLSQPPTRCGSQCNSDGDCDDTEKCCSNACGRICQPGVVPLISCENRNCPANTECLMQGPDAICKEISLQA